MRKEITEAQITELMQAIPRAEEVDRLRAEIERLLQALGLVTTAVPDMEIDVRDPLGMAQRVVAEFERHRAQIERLRENVDRAGKEVERADRLRAEIARVKADERKNRAEIKRLREALRDIERGDYSDPMCERTPEQRARDALKGKP